jgi:hypothetical protein
MGWLGLTLAATLLAGQPASPPVQEPHVQRDFTAADFTERRSRIFDSIGKNAIAIV